MCLGIPGEVTDINEARGLRFAKVKFAGITRDVCLECLSGVSVGDYVLVHVGVAISKIDREEAKRAYAALEVMGMTAELKPEGTTGGGGS